MREEKVNPRLARRDARDEELDRFWEIDALLPPKRSMPKSRNTEAVEVTLDAHDPGTPRAFRLPPREGEVPDVQKTPDAPPMSASVPSAESASAAKGAEITVVHTQSTSAEPRAIRQYIYPHSAEDAKKVTPPDEEYTPQSALLHRVRIYRWKNSYPYYEEFAETARRLQKIKGKPCEPVKFFSYVPQYAQMTRAQLMWYLWLRECLRKEEAPDTDYSYLLLYAYELINLSDQTDPARGQAQLLFLWRAYHERYPQLNSCLLEWICDYGLLHRLPPPAEPGAELLRQIVSGCRLKEYYVGGLQGDGYVQALLRFCCNYDYRKSKFCTPENQALFDETVYAVLFAVSERLLHDGKLFAPAEMGDICLRRDAFAGALCSWRIKRHIEIDYCSFSRSHELRFLITDVVKYTENCLRTHLGVRSKLTIYALPTHLRELIDAATAHLKPRARVHLAKREAAPPAYEKLYEQPPQELSLSHAAEIERSSWDTTQRLIEAFEAQQAPPSHVDPAAEKSEKKDTVLSKTGELPQIPLQRLPALPQAGEDGALADALQPYRAFLSAVRQESAAAQAEAARGLRLMPDAVADAINELAAELTGDILVEDRGGYYAVIEDYRDILERYSEEKKESN